MLKPKDPPYQNTKVDSSKTKAQIEKLIASYGAEAVQWTQSYTTNDLELKFIFEVEVKGIRRKLGFAIKPPMFLRRKRSREQGLINQPQYDQSLRLMYWYLKAKLEAAAYGLDSIEHVFMSEILQSLPDGRQTTLGEVITQRLIVSSDLLSLPEQKTERKVIES